MEAARLLLMQAAFTKQIGGDFGKQASLAKSFATEAANRARYPGLQILSEQGYNREYSLERLARDVRITSIYEGTSEIQRMIIARSIL
ncbi:MAG: alkylation response protein AidB-like acyl-CoA dehydrogenase [Zhongshania sp.]|jgi:alkylation response protein AidB-like acyl-CoA dehydrogenase